MPLQYLEYRQILFLYLNRKITFFSCTQPLISDLQVFLGLEVQTLLPHRSSIISNNNSTTSQIIHLAAKDKLTDFYNRTLYNTSSNSQSFVYDCAHYLQFISFCRCSFVTAGQEYIVKNLFNIVCNSIEF